MLPIASSKIINNQDFTLDPDSGVWKPIQSICHIEEEFSSHGFQILQQMQESHFWYVGRHRFLLAAVENATKCYLNTQRPLSAIDLGGGCGGWIKYLQKHSPALFSELALSDSSLTALDYGQSFVGESVARYLMDLRNIPFKDRWHSAFLLDVLEHTPEERTVLNQIYSALRPGGLLFITVPALAFFWSYNDELAKHVRRYRARDFDELATATGFELLQKRYFMFFLSPLLLLARLKNYDVSHMTQEEKNALISSTHRTPNSFLNKALGMIFSLEAHIKLPFPWGTSLLAVLRKPILC